MPENQEITKTEYHCDCGRKYIVPQDTQGATRKCPRCGRMMQPVQKLEELLSKNERKKNPFKKLDDTLEYEYRFNPQGERLVIRSEPFSLKGLFRKIISLFSFRR